jgi:hypothetical protein
MRSLVWLSKWCSRLPGPELAFLSCYSSTQSRAFSAIGSCINAFATSGQSWPSSAFICYGSCSGCSSSCLIRLGSRLSAPRIPTPSTMTGAEIRSSKKQRPKSRTIAIVLLRNRGDGFRKSREPAPKEAARAFASIQGELWARFVLSLDHDRHFSPNFQSERSDRFKLPLVGLAALSPGCISTRPTGASQSKAITVSISPRIVSHLFSLDSIGIDNLLAADSTFHD